MTSLTRQLRRAQVGAKAFNRARGRRPQPTRVEETRYWALHPTKGWRRFSNKRVVAQYLMARLLNS